MKKYPSFRDKNFLKFLFSQLMSLTGGYIQNVALSSLIVQNHEGKMSLGIFLCVCYLPVFLLSYPASRLIARVPLKPVLLMTEGVLFAMSVLLSVFWQMPYFALLIFGGVWGTVRAVQTPAASSVPRLICKKDTLDSAVGAVNLALSLSRAAGPIISGVIYNFISPQAAFIANALSFIPSLVLLCKTDIAFERQKRAERKKANIGIFLMLTVFVIAFCGTSYNIVFTGICKKLELTKLWFSVFMGCIGVGAAIGAFFYKSKRKLIITGAGIGGCVLALSFLKSGFAVCITAVIYGALDYLFFTSVLSKINGQNDRSSISSAMGIYTAVTTGALPLGYLVMSWISGSFGINPALYFSAAFIALAYLLFFGKIR